MARKSINTTIDQPLYEQIQRLALEQSFKQGKRVYANDLLEEGMRLVLIQHQAQLQSSNKEDADAETTI